MISPNEASLLELIYDRIDAWREADTDLDVCEWLGWTVDEYRSFVERHIAGDLIEGATPR